MFIIRTHQTHSGPHFEHRTNASTLKGAKRFASSLREMLAFDGQGHMDVYEVVDDSGQEREIAQATGSIPAGAKNLRWDA